MDIFRREKLIDALLGFMKSAVEKFGTTLENVTFDFSPSTTLRYFNHADENIPDSEDLRLLKARENMTNDEFKEIFNYCIAHQYIRRYVNDGGYKIRLSDKGFYRAKEKEREDILQNKIQNELIYIGTYKSSDKDLNDLLSDAKQQFLNENVQLALEKLWDALERVKTLTNTNKKKGIEAICQQLADELPEDFFDKEYKQLTLIGNDYQIRHFENNKKSIKNLETKKYLFFRTLSLINLTISRLIS